MSMPRKSFIVVTLLAVFAAAVLFVTYGTVLPAAPLSPIQLEGPSAADSDGSRTIIADQESRRALILNANGELTGVIGCTTVDAPVNAITDVCVSDGRFFVSGINYKADSDVIKEERVAVYDIGGNLQEVIFELPGSDDTVPAIKSLCEIPGGVAIAYENQSASDQVETPINASGGTNATVIKFALYDKEGIRDSGLSGSAEASAYDIAFSLGDQTQFATLSIRGIINDSFSEHKVQLDADHVFTAIDLGKDGTLYACDDTTGSLLARPSNDAAMQPIVDGNGYIGVHVNNGVVSLCDKPSNIVKQCTTSGEVTRSISEVTPSPGFSARMALVWASGIYLAVLALVLIIRKMRRQVASGKTGGIGPMLLSVAVVAAIAIAIGNLSYASYQTLLGQRANQINAYADYLVTTAPELSDAMERANDRNALLGNAEQLGEATENLFDAMRPALGLVSTANNNNIGIYCTLYGRDAKGPFYLFGSSLEHVLGTSAGVSASEGLEDAFSPDYSMSGKLVSGRTMRDDAQYRFVQIPSSDGQSIAGVIEIGSKTKSFMSSVTGDLAHRILELLVMVLVVYLAYCEVRTCGRCLFKYRQQKSANATAAVATLTRPFTLAITMLTGIDSVMTVLIARDLLTHAGMGDSSPLLALPALMLGIGLIVGQALYGAAGSRVGLRRLIVMGAVFMFACACFAGVAVYTSSFWMYCAAKLLMAIPFGLLYALGYSLPRLADNDADRAEAAGGVKRTDTSAAALGTVVGGYAAQGLGNAWVYVIVAVACIPIIIMALNLLPRGMQPLEKIVQPDPGRGRIRDFIMTRMPLALTFFIVVPATIAAGYASFLFPLFSIDLGLTKSNINNIVVLGQLVVYLSINGIDLLEERHGKWLVSTVAILLLGAVFLLFAFNTTLVWSVAVIALVAVLCKSSDGWKAMWLKAAADADVSAGPATGAMFAARSLALIAQPFILGALLSVADSVAVIVIGAICAVCAALFFLITRRQQKANAGN